MLLNEVYCKFLMVDIIRVNKFRNKIMKVMIDIFSFVFCVEVDFFVVINFL